MSQEKLDRINKAMSNAQWGLDKFGRNSPRGKTILEEIKQLKAEKNSLPPELLLEETVNNLKNRFMRAIKAQRQFPDVTINQEDVVKYTKELQNYDFSDDDINRLITTAEADIIDIIRENTLENLKRGLQKHLTTNSTLQINVQEIIDGLSKTPQGIADPIRRAVEIGIETSTIQSIIDTELSLPEEVKIRKLNQLTSQVKSYMDSINFKALLDPSVTVPEDMVQQIAKWESESSIELDRSTEHKILRAKRELEKYSVPQEEINTAIRIGQDTAEDS